MTSNKPKEKDQEETSAAVNKNPCGTCRAMGALVCKCPRKGSGGGGAGGGVGSRGANSSDHSSESGLMAAPTNLEEFFIQSELWLQPDEWNLSFEYNNSDALLSIKLDMEKGSIRFISDKDLSADQQKTMDEFLKTIEQEFNDFKEALIGSEGMQAQRIGNTFLILIPIPKYYDTFLQRLIDKNLVSAHVSPPLSKNLILEPTLEPRSEIELEKDGARNVTAPNPFDISGPKPKGWVPDR